MEVADGAGDDALAATALLLFGPGGQPLPGGYDTNEMSRWVIQTYVGCSGSWRNASPLFFRIDKRGSSVAKKYLEVCRN